MADNEDGVGRAPLDVTRILTTQWLELGHTLRQADLKAQVLLGIDAILLTGSVPILPDAFRASLKPGGRLLAVVGEPPVMQANLVTSMGGGAFNTTSLFETCIAPLRNAVRPERFVF